MLNILKKVAFVAAAISFSSTSMAASFVIDDFSVNQFANITEGSPDQTFTATGATSAIFGGSRQMTLSAADNSDGTFGQILDSNVVGSQLLISNGFGVQGTVSLLWDGGAGGIGAVDEDITLGGTLDFLTMNVLGIDLSTTVAFTLTDTSANTFTSAPASFIGAGIFQSDLAGFTGVDTTHIASIQMVLTGATNWDAGFEFIEVDKEDVPEPASIALLGLGLIGLSFGRRKAK